MITSDEEAEYNILDQGSKLAILKAIFRIRQVLLPDKIESEFCSISEENFETLFLTFFLTSVAAWEFFWDLVL